MAGTEPAQRVVLPRPERLTLRNFTLYRRRSTIDVRFDEEVFCLAGANGLGKSTFLAALSYAMTGAVAKPSATFLGAADYYKDVRDYALRYFDGRVDAADHDIAEVDLEMAIGNWRIELTRGLFAPLELRRLVVHRPEGSEDLSDPSISDTERHGRYVAAVCEATGLRDFSQLVFLQLIVLTFDEQRRLMFWTPRATEQAMFLAFGVSSELASKAEALQRTYDSAESRARNLQWHATGRRKRMSALQEVLEGVPQADDVDDLQATHERLDGELTSAGEDLRLARDARREAELKLDEIAASLFATQTSYEETYRARVGDARIADLHPAVTASIEQARCVVCGTASEDVATRIRASLERHECPLCASGLTESGSEGEAARQRLAELADEIVALEEAQQHARLDTRRKADDVERVEARVRVLSDELETFRAANSQALLRASGEEGLLDEAIRSLTQEVADLLSQKDYEIERRDAAQEGLNALRDELTNRFIEMEHDFVPILSDLAKEFLGVPIQVDLQRRGQAFDLLVTFNGSERRTAEDLSESQRFFMDIALRMAIARKMAGPGQPATLYVDTPEGSLDIAYEMRAGRMFGRFAVNDQPNHIIMTANINTSRLLQELAKYAGRDHMQLVRMTEWTDLTDVQQDAASLFEDAYADIERNLDGAQG